MIEGVVSGLLDEFPIFKRNRVKFLAGLCFIQFLLAIPMVTESGMYWVTLIDWYASGFPLMCAAVCEITCIAWVYGVDRFLYDIKCMIGRTPFLWQWWKATWSFITPLCILLIMVAHLCFYSPVTYNKIAYPSWAEVVGWMAAMFSIMMIPGWAIYQLLTHPRAKGSFMQRVKSLSKCDDDWGPRDPTIDYKYRKGVEMKEHKARCCPLVPGSSSSDVSDPPEYEVAMQDV